MDNREIRLKKMGTSRVGLLRTKPTKAVFDPETHSIYFWNNRHLHHVDAIEQFSNKNIAHLIIHNLRRIIEIQYPSNAPLLREAFLARGRTIDTWFDLYCDHAEELFMSDYAVLKELYPNWEVTMRMPSNQAV